MLSRWLPAVVATVVARSVLAAPDASQLDVELVGKLPFSRGELAAALAARLGDGASANVEVIVTATAEGVVVTSGGRERAVQLGATTGAIAARLVAIEAIDLLAPDDPAAAVAPPPAPPPARPVAAAADVEQPGREPSLTASAAEPHAARRTALLGTAALWSGVNGQAVGASLDFMPGELAGVPIALEVGGAQVVGESVLSMDVATIRVSACAHVSAFELRAGVTVEPVFVAQGAGDVTALVGANGSIRARVPLGAGTSLVLAAGVDVFADQTRYTQFQMPVVTTPWLAPWFATGVEVAR